MYELFFKKFAEKVPLTEDETERIKTYLTPKKLRRKQYLLQSYSVGLGNPKEVDVVISFSGRILEDVQKSTTPANEHTDLRIFLAHGIQDNTLPVHYARRAKSWLEKIGADLAYREYEMGHQINQQVLTDLKKWLDSA